MNRDALLPTKVLALVLSEGRDLGMLTEDGCACLAALATPEACWGNGYLDLRAAVRQALRPRRFAKERSSAKARGETEGEQGGGKR